MIPSSQNLGYRELFAKSLSVFAVLMVFVLQGHVLARQVSADPAQTQRPNIVLVYADDIDCEMIFGQFPHQETASIRFPNLQALAREGVRLSNFHVTTPVCGPSRACLYSGQYAHHNGCRVNDPASVRSRGFDGGFKTFDSKNELASWMKDAGYATAHVGKYLHSDFKPDHALGLSWRSLVPVGWDHFRLSLGGRYYEFPAYIKGSNTFQQSVGKEYRTDWDVRHAIDVLNQHAQSEASLKPLFLCWCPIAAHVARAGHPMVASRHEAMFADAEIPDFEQRLDAKVSAQVSEMGSLRIPSKLCQQRLTTVYRNRLRAMKSIDEGIGAIRTELENLGMAENTLFIFTSDHGFRLAQHRHYGKRLPYDRISRVPFIAAGPNIPKGAQCPELLCNIDIAPTLVQIAGERVPECCDGISFSKVILDPSEQVRREAIAIENWGDAVSHNEVILATYVSLRSRNSIYTEWASGGREFYDLGADPEQLKNRYDQLSPERQIELSKRLRKTRKSNAAPLIAETRCEQMTNHSRVCASHQPVEFSGLVEADAGVEKVELEIRCVDTGEYWDGDDWSDVRRLVNAELQQPSGLVSQWDYGLDTSQVASGSATESASLLAPRNVQLAVVVTDLVGRQTHQASFGFVLSFLDPETSILAHEESEDGKRLTILGNASDLRLIKSVQVSLLDPETRSYWNGSQWQEAFCQLPAKLPQDSRDAAKRDSWQLEVSKPSSSELVLVARTYGVKRYDHSPAIARIELRSGPVVSAKSLTGH